MFSKRDFDFQHMNIHFMSINNAALMDKLNDIPVGIL